MPIYVDDNKTNLWRSTFVIPIRYAQNKFYDDLLLLFCDTIFIFVINFRAKSSSLGTYDENGDFVTDDIPFCDESERRHEQIVTDCNISSSEAKNSFIFETLLCVCKKRTTNIKLCRAHTQNARQA
jgi:hypothetical protein